MKVAKRVAAVMAALAMSLGIINCQSTTVSAGLRINSIRTVKVKKSSSNESKVNTTFTVQDGVIDDGWRFISNYNFTYQTSTRIKIITAVPTDSSHHNLIRVKDRRYVRKDAISNGKKNIFKIALSEGVSEIPYIGKFCDFCEQVYDIIHGFDKTYDAKDDVGRIDLEARSRRHRWVYGYGEGCGWVLLEESDDVKFYTKFSEYKDASKKDTVTIKSCLMKSSVPVVTEKYLRGIFKRARKYPPEAGFSYSDNCFRLEIPTLGVGISADLDTPGMLGLKEPGIH